MNTIEKIGDWGEKHHPVWLDVFRMALGAFFIIKGIELVRSPYELTITIGGSNQEFLSLAILHYIVFTHIVGGILVMAGLGTRIALALLVPVVLLAVIFNHIAAAGIFAVYANFITAFVVLAVTVLFLVYGSGPLSLDKYMKKHPGS